MRIVDVRQAVVPIASQIRNAYIDFSKMTVSIVALVTDVVRDGTPIVGYGFNSNGRYSANCLLRERFIPRLREAPAESRLNAEQNNFDPERVWSVLMQNEKPGGHGLTCGKPHVPLPDAPCVQSPPRPLGNGEYIGHDNPPSRSHSRPSTLRHAPRLTERLGRAGGKST